MAALGLGTREIGFTGGEPFMNPQLSEMLELTLTRGFEALVLTNAMRPMRRHEAALLGLKARHGDRLTLRVSLDHHTAAVHEAERGVATFGKTVDGLSWLARHGFSIAVAGRRLTQESESEARGAFGRLFARLGVPIDAFHPGRLVLFPEMDAGHDVPEITEACLGHPAQAAVGRDVRLQPHGGPPQGLAARQRRRLHAAALRPTVRSRPDAGRRGARAGRHVRGRRRQAMPSALLEVLRARRRQLLGALR